MQSLIAYFLYKIPHCSSTAVKVKFRALSEKNICN